MNYSDKLKTILSITGKTQQSLASELGVTFASLSRWLNQGILPRQKIKEKIDILLENETGIQTAYISKNKYNTFFIKEESIKKYDFKNPIVYIIKNNPDIRDQLILLITYNSNKIEGSTLSEVQTAGIIFHNTAFKNKTLIEHLEAKNHQTALLYTLSHLEEDKKIDEKFILRVHQILMNGIRSDAGMYRNHNVRIVGSFVPTANHVKISELMKNLVKKIDRKTDRLNRIKFFARTHAEFEQIHPFSDGNGRVGRILLSALLMQNNFAPAIIVEKKRMQYYKALNTAQLKEKYELIEEFVLDAVILGFRVIDRKD